jgi:hypothetical protein
MKRSIEVVSDGTADTVEAALGSVECVTLTDDQLDLVLPTAGFDVILPMPGQAPAGPCASNVDEARALDGDAVRQERMSAGEVREFFVRQIATPDRAMERMRGMSLAELELLQGIADQISVGGATDGSQKAALEWSVRIGNFIA